jgi:hypothetical protein
MHTVHYKQAIMSDRKTKIEMETCQEGYQEEYKYREEEQEHYHYVLKFPWRSVFRL